MGGKEDPEDPYMPITYECTAMCIPLIILDFLNDRKVQPMTGEFSRRIRHAAKSYASAKEGCWLTLARIRTGAQLGVVSLDVLDETPFVCVVKRPDKIVFQPLGAPPEDPGRSILHCLHYPEFLINVSFHYSTKIMASRFIWFLAPLDLELPGAS